MPARRPPTAPCACRDFLAARPLVRRSRRLQIRPSHRSREYSLAPACLVVPMQPPLWPKAPADSLAEFDRSPRPKSLRRWPDQSAENSRAAFRGPIRKSCQPAPRRSGRRRRQRRSTRNEPAPDRSRAPPVRMPTARGGGFRWHLQSFSAPARRAPIRRGQSIDDSRPWQPRACRMALRWNHRGDRHR